MSRLRADTLTDRTGTSAPDLTHGATSTTGTFSGDLGGGDVTLSGNASVDGTLTYQDADNINSTGIITARQGIQVSANGFDVTGISTFNSPITVAGITTINESGLHATGVVTATSFAGDGSALTGTNRTISGIASGTLANGQTVIIHSDGKVGFITETALSTPTVSDPVVFESAHTQWTSAVYDSNSNKVVVAYRDKGNSDYGTAIVGTVSGTSITFGKPVIFEYGDVQHVYATYDSNSNKVVIAYRDNGNSSYGTAIVGTVSGTSISFGTAVVFNSETTSYFSATFDSANNKVVIAYRDSGNSGAGTAIVGTVSGTSISFGSAVVYETGNTLRNSSTFDSARNKVIITYYDNENSNDYGTFVVGTVSGTSISFGTPVVFDSSSTSYPSATYDSTNNKVVISYMDGGNSNYGTAVVVNNTGTTLTTENFIGFSDAAYSDGDTATVQIITALDNAQSGLTTGSKHYVQNDGTLSTTAGSPSVLAGTAISDTEIIVKQ